MLSHGPTDPPPNILSAWTSGLIREVRADSSGAKSRHGCEYSDERVPFSSQKKEEKDIQAKKVKRKGQMGQVSTGDQQSRRSSPCQRHVHQSFNEIINKIKVAFPQTVHPDPGMNPPCDEIQPRPLSPWVLEYKFPLARREHHHLQSSLSSTLDPSISWGSSNQVWVELSPNLEPHVLLLQVQNTHSLLAPVTVNKNQGRT